MIEKLIFVTIIGGLFLAVIDAAADVLEAAEDAVDAFNAKVVEMEGGYDG